MAVAASDIQFYLSNPLANTGYSGGGTPGNSLGGYMSTTQISTTPLDDLFVDISPSENAALQVDYQCLFVMNANTTSTAQSVYVWIPETSVSGSATVAMAADAEGIVAYNSSAQQAYLIDSSTQAPVITGSWLVPSATESGGAFIGGVAAQHVQALWFQRTATNGNPGSNVGFQIACSFVTSA